MAYITRSIGIKQSRYTTCISKLVSRYNANTVSIATHAQRNNSDFGGFDFSLNNDDFDTFSNNTRRVDTSRQRKPSFDLFGSRDGSFGGGQKERKTYSRAQIEWTNEALTPFTKDFYTEHPEITKKTDADIEQFRKSNAMIIHGHNIPKPFDSFTHSGLPDICIQHLHKMRIEDPSAIQQQGIPMALSGRDVVGISRTGSGKTLAYLLPLIVHIQAQPIVKRGEGPIGIILAPTRELALQINEEINKYIQSNPDIALKNCAVYGGSDRHRQIQTLRQSPDILVATPGRLLDLLECGETNFKRTTYCVLDEADRMLDMGFRDDLECILSYIRPDKQTLMWSATWPKEIQQIAASYMNDPIRVQIGSTELHANSNIEQAFRPLSSDYEKLDKFMMDMEEICGKDKKTLVFTNTKRNADMLAMKLQSMKIRSAAIHGDKTQAMRERTLGAFRRNDLQCLIATDVVARGIDITDISVVLCYDFPTDIESWVHRIGRTGRGHRKGLALTYITQNEIMTQGKKLETVLKRSKQKIPQFLQQSTLF
eukprot:147062_1